MTRTWQRDQLNESTLTRFNSSENRRQCARYGHPGQFLPNWIHGNILRQMNQTMTPNFRSSVDSNIVSDGFTHLICVCTFGILVLVIRTPIRLKFITLPWASISFVRWQIFVSMTKHTWRYFPGKPTNKPEWSDRKASPRGARLSVLKSAQCWRKNIRPYFGCETWLLSFIIYYCQFQPNYRLMRSYNRRICLVLKKKTNSCV